MAKAKEIITWSTSPQSLIGCIVEVETLDGLRRTGKVTGERTRSDLILIDERGDDAIAQRLTFPLDIELDHDPGDRIEWVRVKKITIR